MRAASAGTRRTRRSRDSYHARVQSRAEHVPEGDLLGDRDLVETLWHESRMRADAERAAAEASARERALNERMHRTALAELDAGHADMLASIDAEHREMIDRIEAETEAAIRKIREEERIIRSKASVQAEDQEEQIQGALDKKVWMAESVFEAAIPAIRKARTELLADFDQQLLRIDGIATEAHRIVRSYRQRVLPEPEGEQPAAGSAQAELRGVEESMRALQSCRIARLFRGPILVVPLLILAVAGAAAGGVLGGASWAALGSGGAVIAGMLATAVLYLVARREVAGPYSDLLGRVGRARASIRAAVDAAERGFREREDTAKRSRDADLAAAEAKYRPKLAEVNRRLQAITNEIAKKIPHYQAKYLRQRSENVAAADELAERRRQAADERRRQALQEEDERHRAVEHEVHLRERDMTASASARWQAAQRQVLASIERLLARDRAAPAPWAAIAAGGWSPPTVAPDGLRLGTVPVRLSAVPGAIPAREDLAWPAEAMRADWDVPVLLDAPARMSLVVEAPSDRRAAGLAILQCAVGRILAALPPGKARFTFVDPIGLGQSFAGFMHLADENVQLVNDRIWTDPRHVEHRLADLTEHMETVIQKYLRNEFASLEEYNRQAGEIAEPHRFLVMADFPVNISEGAAKRLQSILQSGARCGVHVLLLRDPKQPLPPGVEDADLRRAARVVAWTDAPAGWSVDDGALAGLRLRPDPAPDDGTLLQLTKLVGRAARDSSRVEVPFVTVAPRPEERWTLSSAKSLRVPIGRSGATRLQYLTLGTGTSQHVLIAGKTGSGKSSLLNALIVNVALWHSPDEVELWLIDFKKGVEFKAYAACGMPHVRAVAVESDREFGLSILQGLDEELRRRGELFRGANVQNLTDWRALGRSERMPRCLLVIDEFQELFVEDDKVSQDAALLLDRLVRQGRAFGMHAVLGSQTLGGAYGIARSTMGQMGVRIALQCSEADSQLILSDDNAAARLLSRPGEAIYNDAGGLVEGNNPFQVVWLGDDERLRLLDSVRAAPSSGTLPKPIVFEGNLPARPEENGPLRAALAGNATADGDVRVWLGDAVSIKDPTHVRLQRRPGGNVAIIAQSAEAGGALLAMSIASIAAQRLREPPRVVLLDGHAGDEAGDDPVRSVRTALPVDCLVAGVREADAAVLALGEELARRMSPGTPAGATTVLVINGLHRFRSLRRNENDFSMGDGPPTPDRVFGAILRDGPSVGIHVILWADTAANLQRCVDRATMRDLNHKVLFQMSLADSSMLIDSPAASRLGMHRAVLADDDAGTVEKFRPYGPLDRAFVAEMAAALRARGS